ncbi:MFS transporter [Deinococcus aquiradiocola]|uniref:MFS transporter n=1 Tax=Deinococcus aquiradiocola TaxID=393059 RepID=A0A917UQX6_9DEIO|nr:MFS transporter [Deinococcus aquiradiocola]GGJ77793.1 MFS transporter [Deinococcus aquiradiocola]
MSTRTKTPPFQAESAATPANPTAVLAIILVSYLVIVLDISIVLTGLPKIQRDLGFSGTDLAWVQSAYTLAFGGLLLLSARAGDLLGRRRVFLAGLTLFTAASVAVGLSASAGWMIAARAVQGVGAAILAPSSLSLLTANFPEGPGRTRAVGYYGSIGGLGSGVGLVLGGFLADLISWRAGFFINLPIGLLLGWAALRYIPETVRSSGRLDVAGAITSTLGMTAVVYGLMRAATAGWTSSVTLLSLLAGVALLGLFVWNEGRTGTPIMPLHLFRNRERAGALIARVLFLGAMASFWFFTTQYLQEVLGLGALQAGLAFLPASVTIFATALLVSRLTRLFGEARLLGLGLFVGAVGLGWLSRAGVGTPYLTGIALPMLLIGAGQGMALAPMTASGIRGVGPDDAGAASGLVNVAHQLGNSLGLAVLVTVFAAATPSGVDPEAQLAHRLSAALTGATVLQVLCLLVALLLIVWPALKGSRA